ncbi:MAG: TIGR03960 family B12-binding radical SAM protein [bacterium]|jgi:radical SAM family uncharacterized protein/radical SAM-linked protein
MRHLLEARLFPFVNKPGRYIGGELGQIVKSPEGRLKIALGYPDMYEIGMSYLGTQILYHLINSDDRFLCERFYAPDLDAEEILRREKIPYFSLESFRPLREFDVVGFTLAYEMVYTNLLNILDLSGIALRWQDRSRLDPLIIAGGPVAHNPEPLAPFVDFFCLGDAEETIAPILSIIHQQKTEEREKILEAVVRNVPGVYVPRFYNDNGEPTVPFAPPRIRSQRVKSLKIESYSPKPLVPFVETVHDRLSVEVMRGCPRGCRFCQATAIYRPVRVRPVNDILEQVQMQLGSTGFDEVTMLSLSSSDYPHIEELTGLLARELASRRVSLSLPSLRPGTISLSLLESLKLTRKSGLTFAPEAGTERLRALVRKDITDRDLYETLRLAFESGWNLIKLYFMIGLPTETVEDIEGIIEMIKTSSNIARQCRGKNIINVTISPFSPKSHTPFQWDLQLTPEEIRERSEFIRRKAGSSYVNIKLRDPNLSFLEGVIGRGGREMGHVIETVFRMGARFDGWTEGFDFTLWLKAFAACGIDPYSYLRERRFSERLPWAHIELDVSTEQLIKERNRTSTLLKESKPSPTSEPVTVSDDNEEGQFGRSRKKAPAKATVAPNKGNVRIQWGRNGLARFLSHLDNIRVFERAIRRAGLPVEYSQGFNPHMKLSFGPPLPLGFSSEAEYFDISLERPFQPEMAAALEKTLPEGFHIIMAKSVMNTRESLSGKLNRAVYEVPVESNQEIEYRLKQLLERISVEVTRVSKEESRRVDIRPAIFRLEYRRQSSLDPQKACLLMELGVGTAGYARPQEVILESGIVEETLLPMLEIHRKALLFADNGGNFLTPMEF